MENEQAQLHANNIDVLGKKEKNQEDAVMVDLEQSKEQNKNNGGHHTVLAQQLQRTRGHSTTSSDEEVEEGGERKRKKKKKKGLIENIKDKLSGEKEGEAKHDLQETTPQNINEVNNDNETTLGKVESASHEDKKGFLDKLIEKLPGHQKTEDATQITANPDDDEHNNTHPEKKGILEKIKETLPGHHKNNEDNNDVGRKEKLN